MKTSHLTATKAQHILDITFKTKKSAFKMNTERVSQCYSRTNLRYNFFKKKNIDLNKIIELM